MQINGAVDEAQAVMGVARAEAEPGSDLDRMLTRARARPVRVDGRGGDRPVKQSKLKAGSTLVTPGMVEALEHRIDELIDSIDMPTDFVVPGANRASAALDLARTVVRRADGSSWRRRWRAHWSDRI